MLTKFGNQKISITLLIIFLWISENLGAIRVVFKF